MRKRLSLSLSRFGRGGFTLVELMIAVAIIAILAAVLAPSVSTYMRRSSGQSSARDAANMFRMARNQAMSRGEAILATVTQHSGAGNGTIVLYRTQNTALANCTDEVDEEGEENEDYEPRNTDCYALSCVQTSAFTEADEKVKVASLDLKTNSPDMIIGGLDTTDAEDNSTVSEATFCFSPSGRVLTQSGTTFTSDCDAVNARIFLTEGKPGAGYGDLIANPLGGSAPDLDDCMTADDSETVKQEQKDGRDVANFFSIHIPYNGAISVIQ